VARWRSCVHVCCAWAGSHDRKLARPLTCARSPQGAIHPESCDSTWLDHARIFPRPEVRWAIQRFGGDAILTAAAAVPLPPARRLGRGRGVVPQVAGDQRKTRPARRHGHRLRQPRAHGADSRRRSSGAGVVHKVTGALYGWLIQGRPRSSRLIQLSPRSLYRNERENTQRVQRFQSGRGEARTGDLAAVPASLCGEPCRVPQLPHPLKEWGDLVPTRSAWGRHHLGTNPVVLSFVAMLGRRRR
jgi:hypothetical protein